MRIETFARSSHSRSGNESTGLNGPVRIETRSAPYQAPGRQESTGLNGPVRIETSKRLVRSLPGSKSTGLNGPVRIETRNRVWVSRTRPAERPAALSPPRQGKDAAGDSLIAPVARSSAPGRFGLRGWVQSVRALAPARSRVDIASVRCGYSAARGVAPGPETPLRGSSVGVVGGLGVGGLSPPWQPAVSLSADTMTRKTKHNFQENSEHFSRQKIQEQNGERSRMGTIGQVGYPSP